jgi:hypothetical protein
MNYQKLIFSNAFERPEKGFYNYWQQPIAKTESSNSSNWLWLVLCVVFGVFCFWLGYKWDLLFEKDKSTKEVNSEDNLCVNEIEKNQHLL